MSARVHGMTFNESKRRILSTWSDVNDHRISYLEVGQAYIALFEHHPTPPFDKGPLQRRLEGQALRLEGYRR
jgi:hypothetical protein